MTTLTLIYAADTDGNFTDPATGKCWNIPEDRKLFRETIKDKSVICGRKTFEADWKGLTGAARIAVLSTKEWYLQTGIGLEIAMQLRRDYEVIDVISLYSPLGALHYLSSNSNGKGEIFCVGGKQTIESLAPFSSRILLTKIVYDADLERHGGFHSRAAGWFPDQLNGLSTKWQPVGTGKVNAIFPGSDKTWSRYEFRRQPTIDL